MKTTLTLLATLLLASAPADAGVSFASPVEIDTPGATADILVRDLDGDGDLDIASLEVDFSFATSQATGMVNVALNDGAAGFSMVTTFGLGTFPALENAFDRIAAADLDGDGDPDLAAIGTTSPLILLFNDGSGGFGPAVDSGVHVIGSSLNALVDAGDVDGDGDIDLAVGLPGQIATNDGAGAFTAHTFTDDLNPHNLEIVDLDNDGDEDIAFGFRIHLNDGTGVFTEQEGIFPGSFAAECVFADFDGDGDPDVVCAQNFDDELRRASNNGDATFAPMEPIPTITAPIDVHVGHFDADDDLDLLLTHSFGNSVIGIYSGNGDGSFDDPIILPSPDGVDAAVGDLDGDGLDDVVMATGFVFAPDDAPIAVLINDSVSAGAPGDLDGDGVVGAADLALLLGAWGSPGGVADLNRDGDVNAGDLAILLGNWS